MLSYFDKLYERVNWSGLKEFERKVYMIDVEYYESRAKEIESGYLQRLDAHVALLARHIYTSGYKNVLESTLPISSILLSNEFGVVKHSFTNSDVSFVSYEKQDILFIHRRGFVMNDSDICLKPITYCEWVINPDLYYSEGVFSNESIAIKVIRGTASEEEKEYLINLHIEVFRDDTLLKKAYFVLFNSNKMSTSRKVRKLACSNNGYYCVDNEYFYIGEDKVVRQYNYSLDYEYTGIHCFGKYQDSIFIDSLSNRVVYHRLNGAGRMNFTVDIEELRQCDIDKARRNILLGEM